MKGINEFRLNEEKKDFAGWIAIYNGKKLEIDKSEATSISGAKDIAIKKLKVPKSKTGLLAIKTAVNESVNESELNEGVQISVMEHPTEFDAPAFQKFLKSNNIVAKKKGSGVMFTGSFENIVDMLRDQFSYEMKDVQEYLLNKDVTLN